MTVHTMSLWHWTFAEHSFITLCHLLDISSYNLNAAGISAILQSDSEQKWVGCYQRRKNTRKRIIWCMQWSSPGRDLGVEESLEYHVMAAFRTRVLVCVCVHACVLMFLTYNRERYFDSIKYKGRMLALQLFFCVETKSGSKGQLSANTFVWHRQ